MQPRIVTMTTAVLVLAGTLAGAPAPVLSPRLSASIPQTSSGGTALGDYLLLSWNDLGMHCMNQYHADFSILPPYNNIHAQLLRRGDVLNPPRLVTSGATLNYSFPGNTYSVGKTDFWTYAPALFGVTLPDNIGLTGKGLTGTLDPASGHYVAAGVPITPFTDVQPGVEDGYQQALIIAHDSTTGTELARSNPVVPVSVEISCVSSGCHSSVNAILNAHPKVTGFDATKRPILCAKCHADPALGTTGNGEANYFSFRMHDAHKFIDQEVPGIEGCYKCHPGSHTQCLRGVMANQHGLICQNCHGNMANVSSTIETGRVPWVNEPACAGCHTARFGEPNGGLYKLSRGHGGVMCEGCHNSTHAEWPSREYRDNANAIAIQGTAAPLGNCVSCHGVVPAGLGPHDLPATGVPGQEILAGARPMVISPNPTRGACTIRFQAKSAGTGTLLVFDAQGRTIRLIEMGAVKPGTVQAAWDGSDGHGGKASPGVYFARWQQGDSRAAAKFVIVR